MSAICRIMRSLSEVSRNEKRMRPIHLKEVLVSIEQIGWKTFLRGEENLIKGEKKLHCYSNRRANNANFLCRYSANFSAPPLPTPPKFLGIR